MSKIRKVLVAVIGLCVFFSFTGYASTVTWESAPGNHGNSILLSENDIMARDEYRTVARGNFLSAGVSEIINEQNGNMRINIDTYAHHDVDRIFHTVFLDQWDEEDQDWYQVNSWNFAETKEDTEDGKLSDLLTTITVSGYETNRYYRVRGLHAAEYNGEVEACATETHGVLITDGPT